MNESQEQPLDSKESLEIIRSMITQAKGDFRANAFHFLLWGWIVMTGSLGHFFLLEYSSLPYPELAWSVIIVGIIGSVLKGVQQNRDSRVKTYTGNIYAVIWISFFINYIVLMIFIAKINFYITPITLLLAAGATLISGSLLRFRPLQLGAAGIWVAGISSFMVTLPYQLLMMAAAIFLGYLIPGYLLKNKKGDV
jgi:hypothetical protein